MGEGMVRVVHEVPEVPEVSVVQWCCSLHSTKAEGEGGLLRHLEVRLVMLMA